ncbi:MAG: FAD-dependent oxidoreductase [Patescibacteria group bacterium]
MHNNGKQNIVILGAGFGGLMAALTLAKMLRRSRLYERYNVALVDRNNYHTYTPALYEIAAIPKGEAEAVCLKSSNCIPLDDIVSPYAIRFIQDDVRGLNPAGKTVMLRDTGALPYAYLIIALGSETNYFNIPGLAEHSVTLKTFLDAIRIRNRIEELVESKEALTIVVGGGGPTGVELIAEFSNFICALARRNKKEKNTCSVELILVEASAEILHGFALWMIQGAFRRLGALGVSVRVGVPITEVTDRHILLQDGNSISFDLFIWAGGVKGNSALASFGIPLGPKGNIAVTENLAADGDIFAIGDSAFFVHRETQAPLPWNVPIAEEEARIVAANIIRKIRAVPLIPFRPMRRYPFILAVGKKYALADFVFFHFSGVLGWIAKLFVELRYFFFILPFFKAVRIWLQNVKAYTSND